MRLATLLLALALVGCNDYIIDEDLTGGETPQPQPVPELPAVTLKGPSEVRPGDAPMYKAGQFSEAVTYEFQADGVDVVFLTRDSNEDRFFFTEVIGEGQTELRVTVLNADGEAIAFARRWVESTY
ncbi:MAG: hypothetical protein AAGI52_14355 [Bacteroidota bacterium]